MFTVNVNFRKELHRVCPLFSIKIYQQKMETVWKIEAKTGRLSQNSISLEYSLTSFLSLKYR